MIYDSNDRQNKLSNKHTHDFLEYYCNKENDFDYAVLLNGKWGTGKTWFAKEFMKTIQTKPSTNKSDNKKEKTWFKHCLAWFKQVLNQDENTFLISLYGTDCIHSLDINILNLIAPIKKISKGSTIIKDVLKNKTGINANFNFAVRIAVKKIIKKHQTCVLIFDDIERTSIELETLFGYLSNIIEQTEYNCKIILLANEDKLQNSNSTPDKSYLAIKEKLIGKTFNIKPNFDNAFLCFLENIKDHTLKEIYIKNKSLIHQLFIESGYTNLRHVRHILEDFSRFYDVLPEDAKDKEELIVKLLTEFFVLSSELKAAAFSIGDIEKLKTQYMQESYENSINDDNTKAEQKPNIFDKYSQFYLLSLTLTTSTWCNILSNTLIVKDIEDAIYNSGYFPKKQEDWAPLCHYYKTSDVDFQEALTKTEKGLADSKYLKIEEVIQIFSIFIKLSEVKLYTKSKNDILNFFKKYIDNNQDRLWDKDKFYIENIAARYYSGREFKESNELSIFRRYLDQKQYQIIIDQGDANLIELLHKNRRLFYMQLIDDNSHDTGQRNTYNDKPILSKISPKKLVNDLNKNSKFLSDLPYTLQERYSSPKTKEFESEKQWLTDVVQELEEEAIKRKGKASGLQFEQAKNAIKNEILPKIIILPEEENYFA